MIFTFRSLMISHIRTTNGCMIYLNIKIIFSIFTCCGNTKKFTTYSFQITVSKPDSVHITSPRNGLRHFLGKLFFTMGKSKFKCGSKIHMLTTVLEITDFDKWQCPIFKQSFLGPINFDWVTLTCQLQRCECFYAIISLRLY